MRKEQIADLTSLRFIETKTNIIFIGSSGVGKTHLATAIGIEAASQRISTYFINFAQLMEKFKRAAKENRVEQVVKHYLKYTVLIIDEIGYLPVDKVAAYGFFQLIAARYEFRPTILTTNQSFSKWPDVFGDAIIANAIIDRLVHHCEIIKITGHSYRVKDRNLFDEDAQAFVNALSSINAMNSLEEVVEFIIENFPHWNLNSDVVYRFMMAVRRKVN